MANFWKPPPYKAIAPLAPKQVTLPVALTEGGLPLPARGTQWSRYQVDVFDDVKTGNGHTVIEAYAGASKTTTIVASLSLIPAREQVFFSAFNKRIVQELQDRVPWTVSVNTLHSYGYRAIRMSYGDVKVNKQRMRLLLDDLCDDSISYETQEQLKETIIAAKNTLIEESVDGIDHLIDSHGVSTGCEAEHVKTGTLCLPHDTASQPACLKRLRFITIVLEVLKRSRIVNGEIDYDDMVWLPIVHNLPVEQFDRCFIDEAQDLNAPQIELAMRSVKSSGRFTAVGDKFQAIYLFRYADSESLANIRNHFDAKVLKLPISYRCPRSVIELAREYVPDIEPAPHAQEGVVERISQQQMHLLAGPGDFILSRTNAPLLSHALRFFTLNKRAFIYGKDIGRTLSKFVRSSKTHTIEELLSYTKIWFLGEKSRLLDRSPPRVREFYMAQDKARCIEVLARSSATIDELLERIEYVFKEANDHNSVILSTVHRCKGLESNRVFVLIDTFRNRPEYWQKYARTAKWLEERLAENDTQEERNVYYVAVTRSKHSLFIVLPSITGSVVPVGPFEDE